MTRPKRINLAGLIYHVICRADQDDVVFTNDKDKERFLEYSEKVKRDRSKNKAL